MAKKSEETVHEAVIISEVLTKNIPKDFKNDLEDFLKSSTENEIKEFNPVLKAIEDMQSFKQLKYEKGNKESIQAYKDSKKFIGSFNTSITAVKKTLKDPHIEYNRKVDAIYNYFKQESDNTKNCLEVNFKEYLDEEAQKKADADAKKKEKELAAIAELSEQNKEQAEKLAKQKHNTRKLEIEASINAISFDVNTKSPTMNMEGLNQLKISLNAKRFENYVSEFDIDEFGFTPEEVDFFKKSFDTSISICNTTIDTYVKSLELENQNKELEQKNEVLQASTPAAFGQDDIDDEPFAPNVAFQNEEKPEVPLTDLDKFLNVLELLKGFDNAVDDLTKSIKETEFQDEALTKIVGIISLRSLPQVKEWSTKLVDWTDGKVNKYKEFLNNQVK